jgi:hypothetical protein
MLGRCYCMVALLLMLVGCRTSPYVTAHIESVNAEYRELEDYVYCLEEENARLVQQLEAARQRGTGGQQPAGGGLLRRRASGRAGADAPAIEPAAPQGPTIEIPGSSSPAPPQIELPNPMSSLLEQSSEVLLAAAAEPLPKAAAPPDERVTHIVLNPQLTGGADFDGQPGDDGLRIVLEPRNAADQFVPQAGEVSIVVLDPSRQGEAARLARWDFDAADTQRMLARDKAARGIKLELPWPAGPPATSRLKLFVRFETADGRKLQTDREVAVTPPGLVIHRWTPRPPERPRQSSAASEREPLPQDAAPTPMPLAAQPAAAVAASTAASPPPASLSSDAPAASRLRPSWSPHR